MRKVTQKGAHKTALPTAATSWNYNPVKSTYFRFFETGDVIWVDVNYVIEVKYALEKSLLLTGLTCTQIDF